MQQATTYRTRADAITALDHSNEPSARCARALLDTPEMRDNVHAKNNGAVIISVQDVQRPDGGAAVQCVVQQVAAPDAPIPPIDVHALGSEPVADEPV